MSSGLLFLLFQWYSSYGWFPCVADFEKAVVFNSLKDVVFFKYYALEEFFSTSISHAFWMKC
jgi:hypothetical protein